jgi:hypothetical protein
MASVSAEPESRASREGTDGGDLRPAGTGPVAALASHLPYWRRELVDIVSAVLDRVHPMPARYELSKFLVQIGRLELAEEAVGEDAQAPAALVAIANQLYVTALTDWEVGIRLLELALADIFPADRVRNGTIAHHSTLLDVLGERAGLRACLPLLEPLSQGQQKRLAMQAFILRETADLLAGETGPHGPGADAA